MKGTWHVDVYTLVILSRIILLRMRNISDHFVEKVEGIVEKYGRGRQVTHENKTGRRKDVICMPDN